MENITSGFDFDIQLDDLEESAKIDGYGQAKLLSDDELTLLFTQGFTRDRDRTLYAICLFTGCRISEALQLTAEMISGGFVTFARKTRKGKTATQQVKIVPSLQQFLDAWADKPKSGNLFPSRRGTQKQPYMSRGTADTILKQACDLVGIHGVSTHSFRRTYITKLRAHGYSPAQIQKRTGHKRRENLMHYFDQI